MSTSKPAATEAAPQEANQQPEIEHSDNGIPAATESTDGTDDGADGDEVKVPGETEEPASDDSTAAAAPKKKRDPQKRIDRLTRKLNDSQRREQELAAKNSELEKQLAAKPAGEKPAAEKTDFTDPADPKPKSEDFDTYELYMEELAAWNGRVTERRLEHKRSKETKTATPSTDTMSPEDVKVRNDFKAKGEETYGAEFAEAMMDETLPISQTMGEFLFDSEVGTDILMHLDDDRELAKKISKMGARAAIRELEKLETEYKKPAAPGADPGEEEEAEEDEDEVHQPTAKQPAKKVSKAPEPANALDTGGRGSRSVNLETADMDTYARVRLKQQKQRSM